MSLGPLRCARRPGRGGFLACLALAAALATTGSVAGELPEDSVYRLEATLTDQSGQAFGFAEGVGQVRLATMFYASCPYVCPLIVEQIKRIEHELTEHERARLRVLLITLEVDKDTPEVLAAVAAKRRVDTSRWTLARPHASDLRKLSALLSVQYRKLPDGNFNHSSVINLIDRDGRVLARTSKLEGAPDPDFLVALRAALAEPVAAAR
ncbi:MAG TPA: SCO family protein [Xanthomonadaceae bacterium]|nr:SCO family protein [Xanthomonadaceae bacterium]